ncbi:type II toxin-antitoxin system RatA family toxin [Halothiobacillus sp. DCM-1]|uniref:type II toxin-antitoxin system RatA family toxin n=1 Tax=Halothiobacillus sp. DCM-1 TaxID=3112558 RepID=UPI003248B26D
MSQEISRHLRVPYTAGQMYALVNDVAAYPKFLPWCDSARVLREIPEEMDARIGMKLGAFHKSFATRNRNEPGKKIEVSLLDGPFKSLQGAWSFHDLPDGGSIIRLNMQFEFSTRLVELAIGPIFREIVRNLIQAFEQRAQAVYGTAPVHGENA